MAYPKADGDYERLVFAVFQGGYFDLHIGVTPTSGAETPA